MSMQSKTVRKSTQTSQTSKTGLSLRVSCGEWLMAIEADYVVHVALIDDVATHFQPVQSAQAGVLGRLSFNQQSYAAFDLCELFRLAGDAQAWVLLRIPTGPKSWLPIALRTGSCRTVGRTAHVQAARLPEGMCGTERAPFRGAFVPNQAESGSARNVACGLVLDVARLLTPVEIEIARELTSKRKSAA